MLNHQFNGCVRISTTVRTEEAGSKIDADNASSFTDRNSPSSKGPSMLGLFGGVTSPIFTNDFRLCPADARENTPLLPKRRAR